MKKVLVAEDVEIISTMITRVLEKLGIEVLVAADGEQCLAMARAQMPDLIILDLMMPKIHGLEVLQALHEDPQLRDKGVIICSAKKFNSEVQQIYRDMGVFAFLPKPFDRKELEEMAKRFFSQEEAKASVIAAQLYTLRDFTKTPDDIRATMKKVRQLGYDAVQLSALGPIDPHNLKDLLDAEELKVVATHTGYDRICDEPQAVIDDHLLWNCPHVAIGGLPGQYRNAEGFGRFAREASEAVKPLIDAGLTFSYHNHSFELERFGAKTGLDILMEESDPSAFSFEIDTYWIQHGGGNPASWLEKLKGRMHVVHLKDMAMDGGTQLFAEVGEGNLEWEAILKACREAEIKWYIIEQDTCQRDPFDCLGTSLANLQAMGLH